MNIELTPHEKSNFVLNTTSDLTRLVGDNYLSKMENLVGDSKNIIQSKLTSKDTDGTKREGITLSLQPYLMTVSAISVFVNKREGYRLALDFKEDITYKGLTKMLYGDKVDNLSERVYFISISDHNRKHYLDFDIDSCPKDFDIMDNTMGDPKIDSTLEQINELIKDDDKLVTHLYETFLR